VSLTDEQVDAILEDAGRLARIEAKLERIEATLGKFDQMVTGFVSGPGIAAMFKAIKGAKG
jgi:hypothetical protein